MSYADSEKQRSYQRAYVKRRRDAWIAEHGPCVRCGSWEDLEVDHVDPSTKVSHNVWSWATHRREAELAKCQVLCSACHKEKSAAELPFAGFHTHHPVAIQKRAELSQAPATVVGEVT